MDWTAILALITEAEPLVANILSAWATPTNTMGKVAAVAQTLSAASQTTLGQIAAIQFPRLAASVGAAAVLLQIKHPTAIQEVQGALNLLGAAEAPLVKVRRLHRASVPEPRVRPIIDILIVQEAIKLN